MAAISIGATTPNAAAVTNSSRAKGFDSVMAGTGHRASSANDDEDARAADKVADKDEDQDQADRKAKAGRDARAQDAGEDPAALLALASSVAAITRADAAAKSASDKAAVTSGTPTPGAATAAQTAQQGATEATPDAAALAAMLAGAAQPAQPQDAKVGKVAQKSMIDVGTASTADILAARAAKVAPVAAQGDGKDAADADTGTGDGDTAPAPLLGMATSTFTPIATTGSGDVVPTSGEVLATGSADRQLDLAKGDAWLDGLARDIVSSADSSGKLNFQLSPQALGDLHVELTRGDDGTAVKMTTATADAQAILSDAKPRLIESARAHGVHISDATIDLGGAGTATSHDPQRDFSQGDSGSSSQSSTTTADNGNNASQQGQSQPQSEPDFYHSARRTGTAAITTRDSRQDLDAGYA